MNFNNNRRELTPEEKFEKMLEKYLKTSKDKFNDINKSKNRKRPDQRYKVKLNREVVKHEKMR